MMRLLSFLLAVAPLLLEGAPELSLTSPTDYQVFQRQFRKEGSVRITGSVKDAPGAQVEIRLVGSKRKGEWRPVKTTAQSTFDTFITKPSGGWYRCEARLTQGGKTLAECVVAHVGVGEVFLVAGQSNSANHGEEKQKAKSGMVSSFDRLNWHPADDPQRGASGTGGSFMPPLGDILAEKFGVPIGFIPIGIGATSVREWLPSGVPFPAPPTLVYRVRQLPDGGWESNGVAFTTLVSRQQQFGPRGFRAVLWHQGESDANQKDPTRTLPGSLYEAYLRRIIRDSRQAAGWDAPWFVAQVSYHVPGDEASTDIREAQAALWKSGLALPGPDSDALKGELRERGGKGVHFSGPGLREHARLWAERIAPWLEQQLEEK
ncbi:MAG: hypothetical protein RL592_1028 [Verrucomicrobiota bacterium]